MKMNKSRELPNLILRTVPEDEVKRRLALVYEFILSWPDPPELTETAVSEDFGENTEPAAGALTRDEQEP
jgi:hypothetical protein